MTAPENVTVPGRVLQDRGPLSPSEAIAVYLVRADDGPGVSQADAARIMGIDPRNVHTLLRRAEDKGVSA